MPLNPTRARRHPDAGRVSRAPRSPQSDVARAPRHHRSRKHPLPTARAAARRRERRSAAADGNARRRANASLSTPPTRPAPAATLRSIRSVSASSTTTRSAPFAPWTASAPSTRPVSSSRCDPTSPDPSRAPSSSRTSSSQLGRGPELRRRAVVPLLARTHGDAERRLLDTRPFATDSAIPGGNIRAAHGAHRARPTLSATCAHGELAPCNARSRNGWSRRKLLASLGLSGAAWPLLPLLNARGADRDATRSACCSLFSPDGAAARDYNTVIDWRPTGTETSFTLHPMQQPLDAVQVEARDPVGPHA